MKKSLGVCFTALAGMLVLSSHALAAPAAAASSALQEWQPPDTGGDGFPPRPIPGGGGGIGTRVLTGPTYEADHENELIPESQTTLSLAPGAILYPNGVIRQWRQNGSSVKQTVVVIGARNRAPGDLRLTHDIALEVKGNLLRPAVHLRPEDVEKMGGATIRMDGTIVFKNDTVYLPSGKVLKPGESDIVYWPDETITVRGKPVPFNTLPLNVSGQTILYRNGTLVDVNGRAFVPQTVYKKEQVMLALYGPLVRLEVLARADQLAGGATLRTDGTILLADGSVLHPDGSYTSTSGKKMAKMP